ncbi:variable surface protein [Plasmodium gonderi]|uniref:Variable surface protein n=1 Tax=Plasmodium gonderi TaxID=77519 RepID=A0A1Y1JS40_PLAGO|nr:variable surface protein [Plasmodium gonderi]GAW84007.1 variable surface protein [Plasmodium gonderi]
MDTTYTNELDTSKLPSKRIYNILNEESIDLRDIHARCELCLPNSHNKNEYIRLCSKLVKYLQKKNDIWKRLKISGYHCNLFSYWLYEKLLRMLDNNERNTYDILDKIQQIAYDVMKYKGGNLFIKCDLDRNFKTKEVWEWKKTFYDYCLDFDTIKNMHEPDEVNCNKINNYIKEKKKVFNYFKNICQNKNLGSHECPDVYSNCKHCDPEELINHFKCHSQEDQQMITIDPTFQEEEQEQEQQDEQEQSLKPNLVESPRGEPRHSEILTPYTHGISRATYDNYSSAKTFGKSLLGVVMISMIFGIIYNFTSIGKRLHHTIGKLKNSIINKNGDNNTSFPYNSEYDYPLNEYREEHFVGYNTY